MGGASPYLLVHTRRPAGEGGVGGGGEGGGGEGGGGGGGGGEGGKREGRRGMKSGGEGGRGREREGEGGRGGSRIIDIDIPWLYPRVSSEYCSCGNEKSW